MRLRLKFDRPSGRDLTVFGGYCVASAIYIAIGVAAFDFMLSFWVAAAYLLVTAWLIPTLARRLR
ncbi:MAG TPA: hypothetical protein VFK62_08990 [Gaiellaceae bacterium]|nr:hypothetical protein [Gaiellaceae bacterium]